MSDVKRYDMIAVTRCGEGWQELQLEAEGDWMRHEAHAQIVAAKDAEIRRLREALTLAEHKIGQYLQGQYPDGVSLGNILATLRAALNPPQQKEGQ